MLRSVNFRICTPRPPDKLNCLDNPSLRVWSKCKCGLRIQKEDENEDYGEDQDEAVPTHGNPGSCFACYYKTRPRNHVFHRSNLDTHRIIKEGNTGARS